MKKILYIYGYGSNPKDSSTMKVVKKVVNELGFDLISIEYNKNIQILELICLINILKIIILNM